MLVLPQLATGPPQSLMQQRERFTPEYLTACQLRQSLCHWEVFTCCFTPSLGALALVVPEQEAAPSLDCLNAARVTNHHDIHL